MAADWSGLLPELVIEIAKNIACVADQVSFANVCDSWQSAISTLENFFVSQPQHPYLLLPDNTNQNKPYGVREIFVLTPDGDGHGDGKIVEIFLPEAANRRCMSSLGWLLTVTVAEDGSNDSIGASLVHPFTRREIHLPNLDTFPNYEWLDPGYGHMITKMVLSANPLYTDDFFVMVLCLGTGRAGYCRPGFDSWIKLPPEGYGSVKDINYHNGRLYVVDRDGMIASCDMRDDQTRILHGQPKEDLDGHLCSCSGIFQKHPRLPEIEYFDRLPYVLGGFDDDDKLMLVLRFGIKGITNGYNDKDNATTGFQVLKMDANANANVNDDTWEKVESLGDRALFLGYNTSIPVKADGCIVKPNCIYFTEDFCERFSQHEDGGGTDMGIYHLSDGSIEPHFKGESRSRISPPVWVVPN